MKKVSVIMPNYNHAPYLKERIDSILAQDYPIYEVILLDDASSDGSKAILESYSTDSRVKKLLINEVNSGNTFIQWGRGLEESEGDYVWIAESDDVAEPTFLSRSVEVLERENAVLSFCHSEWIDGEGRAIEHITDRVWKHDFSMEGELFVRQYLLGYTSICNASSVLFRREASMRVDMAQVAKYSASGDRLFWIEMALQGKVSYISDDLNHFRQHTQKVSGGAEYKGINIVQDHEIYHMASSKLSLSDQERKLINGYHWKAMHRSTVSPAGRKSAMEAWGVEPEFGRLSFLFYLLHRAKEKC